MWSKDDIRIELDDEISDGRIFTISLVTPAGTLKVMAEADGQSKYPILRRFHIQGENVEAQEFGIVRLRWLAHAVMEAMDLDGFILEGDVRTTGANPGRRPRPLRFTGRRRS